MATVKPNEVTAHDLAELMVGSELPTPETTESTVTDIVALDVDPSHVVDDEDGYWSTTSPSRYGVARWWESPAWKATASPNWWTPSLAPVR